MKGGVEELRKYLARNPMYARRVAVFLEIGLAEKYVLEERIGEFGEIGLLPPEGEVSDLLTALRLERGISHMLWAYYAPAAKRDEGFSVDDSIEWASRQEGLYPGLRSTREEVFGAKPKEKRQGKIIRQKFQ